MKIIQQCLNVYTLDSDNENILPLQISGIYDAELKLIYYAIKKVKIHIIFV